MSVAPNTMRQRVFAGTFTLSFPPFLSETMRPFTVSRLAQTFSGAP